RLALQAPADAALIGWATISLSEQAIASIWFAKLRALLIAIAVMWISASAGAFILATRSRRAAYQLRSLIGEYEAGRLNARLAQPLPPDLQELATALMTMSQAMQRGQRELQRKVEVITSELRETLEAVEV